MVNYKHPSHGVTIFTLSVFTVTMTVIVMGVQWEWVIFSALGSSKSPGTSFVRDKKDSFDV